ncbi:hypothetical protein FA13DRAFT_220311 [Coprinellus micaceus]|uniref:CBM1 domain-containing protein n=1 Tax=Coprinellus micaceus TaxID=71717 RepID=A0A4Y7TES1_COPMI|nr:hypothetical protein FA13DRAFT_220311 [Coprinellus micaceus]
MAKSLVFAAAACALVVGGVNAQSAAPAYGQCGGQDWTGPTTCVSGYVCQTTNTWYSQCVPGSAPVPTTTTVTTPAPAPTTPTPTTTTATGTFPAPQAPTAVPTLIDGYSFVRAVTSPNFHKYLMSETWGTPGDAVLGEYTKAALFKVTSGQLVQGVSGQQTALYAKVDKTPLSDGKRLRVYWDTTPSTSGTFRWSGDTLEWSDPSVTRPQANAWLVCPDGQGNKDLFINLGAYSYQTPAGCADHTIHAYTGPIAVD